MQCIKEYIQSFPNDYGDTHIDVDEWEYSLSREFRVYQFVITQIGLYSNSLVCLPTGLGKTYIAAQIIRNFAKWFPNKKIFFLAPTRPLVQQQCEAMSQFGVVGHLTKKDREYKEQIYFSTPQILNNDMHKQLDIVLIIFDEAHKAVGDYAYTTIIQKLPSDVRIIGLSATPGNNIEQIQNVITNLRISQLVIRDEEHPDVKPYMKFREIQKIVISFDNCPYIQELNDKMQPMLNAILGFSILPVELVRCCRAELFSYGSCYRIKEFLQGENMPGIIGPVHAKLVYGYLQSLSQLSYAKKVLLEQGIKPYLKFMGIDDQKEEHPKVFKLLEILQAHFEQTQSKVIVFTNSRDNAHQLCKHINELPLAKAAIFVGQSKNGMKQKEQLNVIQQFKQDLNVLVATSIAEEGLDIGEVDLIICYDSGFSITRMTQRMGRTGRKNNGKIIVLVTQGKEEQDYEKAKLKNKKLMKELAQCDINFYSFNPRFLNKHPDCKIVDGSIEDLYLQIQSFKLIQLEAAKQINNIKSKKIMKKESILTKIKPIESYLQVKNDKIKMVNQENIKQSSKIKSTKKIVSFMKIDSFFKKKEQSEQTKVPTNREHELQNQNHLLNDNFDSDIILDDYLNKIIAQNKLDSIEDDSNDQETKQIEFIRNEKFQKKIIARESIGNQTFDDFCDLGQFFQSSQKKDKRIEY